jgi:hypothetical protein
VSRLRTPTAHLIPPRLRAREATPTPPPCPSSGERELSGDDDACNQPVKGRGSKAKAEIDDPRGGRIADYRPEFGGVASAGVRSDARRGRRMVPADARAVCMGML